ncbi:MAG: 30S ribosomal protein S12 methylthiotransferase RimO [Desulfobacterales bacterium]|nr:30S ribosomal protein S12 methylthiotransferase RimO [Desulfobacterales bacterium]
MKVHLISLGCFRNLVDSEVMLGQLSKSGCQFTADPSEANVIIINTCAFIASSKKESNDAIHYASKFKQQGNCERIIVVGCLPQRHQASLKKTFPDVDVFLGTGEYDQIVSVVTQPISSRIIKCSDPNQYSHPESWMMNRIPSTFPATHIKIAEGCNKHCTYCIIPALRGKYRSRSPSTILSEMTHFMNHQFKEFNLVAQDTTCYGLDLNPVYSLQQLILDISTLSNDIWLRVLYGHPESITEEFIKEVSLHENVCPYFDLPIQHASDTILKRMGRHYRSADLYRLFETIRRLMPHAALRTTLLIGFPGETDQDIKYLESFIRDIRFDHLGIFQYSDASDLASHRLSPHVPKRAAQERYHHLMHIQAELSKLNNQKYIGTTQQVLIESQEEGRRTYIGRTRFQGPEVDGLTYVHVSKNISVGSFVDVRITDSSEYDLIGEQHI